MAIQRVDELREPVVVGQRYLVPTLHYPWSGRLAWWPVIGPKHEDAEIIGFPHQHYHVDGRFLTSAQERWADERWRYRGLAVALAGYPLCSRNVPHGDSVYWAKVCRRSTLSYPDTAGSGNDFLPPLRAAYVSDRLRETDRGWVCPHRGAHLSSIAPDEHGVITCPLHGLRWCAKTGVAAP